MSLILEALRKIEREKEAPARGMVVVAAPAWTARRTPAWVVALGAAAIGAALAVLLVRPRAPGVAEVPARPSAAAERAAARPAATPGTAEVPPVARPTLLVPPARTAGPVPDGDAPAAPPAIPSAPVPPAASPTDPVLALQAISERDGLPVAVVNETVVEVGDVVAGARVLRIGAGEVELERERDGRRFVLRF